MHWILAFLSIFISVIGYQDTFEIIVKEHPKPRKGAKHIHWCTMCGADNRYEFLKETIPIIEPYFDQIHIIDNGSTDLTSTLVKLSSKITYKRIDNWNGNWTTCYLESIRHVAEGEWFMFHDSDERPNAKLLKNLKRVTRYGDKHKRNAFFVTACGHSYDDQENMQTEYESVIRKNQSFGKYNFIKRVDLKITSFGGHCGFCPIKNKSKRLNDIDSNFFYNHYKSRFDVRKSAFAHGLMYPTSFNGLKSYAKEIISLREVLGIQTMSKLYEMLYTKNIPPKFLELFKSWQFAGDEATEIWELVIRDHCEGVSKMYCPSPCCAY